MNIHSNIKIGKSLISFPDDLVEPSITLVAGAQDINFFNTNDPVNYVSVVGWSIGNSDATGNIVDDLIIKEYQYGATEWTERFRMQFLNGNIGLGVVSPIAAIHIKKDTPEMIIMDGDGDTARVIRVNDALSSESGSPLIISSGNAIDSGYNGGDLTIQGGNGSVGGNIYITPGGGNVDQDGHVIMVANTTGGCVSIGHTNTPNGKLDIYNPNGYEQFVMQTPYTPGNSSDTNGSVGSVAWDDDYFYMKTGSGWGRITWDYSW